MNSVIFKVFKNSEEESNSKIIEDKEYVCNLDENIIDIKNRILKGSFPESKFNYLNIENITERVYKDYGKLFFDLGLVPSTVDNYKLEQFTNENRVFSFLCIPCNIEIKKKEPLKNNMKQKIFKDEKNFKFNEDDFPALS